MEYSKYLDYLRQWLAAHNDKVKIKISPLSYEQWKDWCCNKNMQTKKFMVSITEIYTRVVDIEANSKKEAEDLTTEKINIGEIDLPCDGEGYDYTNSIEIIGEVE